MALYLQMGSQTARYPDEHLAGCGVHGHAEDEGERQELCAGLRQQGQHHAPATRHRSGLTVSLYLDLVYSN